MLGQIKSLRVTSCSHFSRNSEESATLQMFNIPQFKILSMNPTRKVTGKTITIFSIFDHVLGISHSQFFFKLRSLQKLLQLCCNINVSIAMLERLPVVKRISFSSWSFLDAISGSNKL